MWLWAVIPGPVAAGTVLVIVAGRRRRSGTTCSPVDVTALIRSAGYRAGCIDGPLPDMVAAGDAAANPGVTAPHLRATVTAAR